MNTNEQVQMIGRNLRRARKAVNLTQTELGQRAGIGQSYVGQIERSEKNVTIEILVKLCGAIGITVGELMQMPPNGPDDGDSVMVDSELLPELHHAA